MSDKEIYKVSSRGLKKIQQMEKQYDDVLFPPNEIPEGVSLIHPKDMLKYIPVTKNKWWMEIKNWFWVTLWRMGIKTNKTILQ